MPSGQCDEQTPIKYLDPDNGKHQSSLGWLWVMSRPKSDVVFDWRLSRRHAELDKLIGPDYEGLLQSDGYEAYQNYQKNNAKVVWIGCWAHARRKFMESLKDSPRESDLILRLIGRLYGNEEAYRVENLNPAERGQRRQKETSNTLRRLYRVMLFCARQALPKSKLGEACQYALGHWKSLTEYARHGEVEIDNNLTDEARSAEMA